MAAAARALCSPSIRRRSFITMHCRDNGRACTRYILMRLTTKETRTPGIHSKPHASVAIVDCKVRAPLCEQLSFVPVKGSNRLNANHLIIHDYDV